jgi:hypothetical protein
MKNKSYLEGKFIIIKPGYYFFHQDPVLEDRVHPEDK